MDERNKRIAKTIALNTALAGAGVGAGYLAGGGIARALSTSPKFRQQISRMTPSQYRTIQAGVKGLAATAGLGAGAYTSYRLAKALDKEDTAEKTAEACTKFYMEWL